MVTLSDSQRTKNNDVSNAEILLGQGICNNVLRKIKYATSVQNEDTTHVYVNHPRLCKSSTTHVYEVNAIQEDQTAEQISQDRDVAAYVNYMQAGDLIPRRELVHTDDSTANSIRFESKSVNQIDEFDLKGHLVRVRCGQNDLVFIADTGSPTSFINQQAANLIVSTVKSARRVQTTKTDEANRMICYNGYKIPSF